MKVYEYAPAQRHCREGMAVEVDGRLLDTFWGAYGSDRHVLTPAEVADATFVFDTDDYDDVTNPHNRMEPSEWSARSEGDRQIISEQHGLRLRHFIRKGSDPSWQMRVDNARELLRQATARRDAAESSVKWAQVDLDAILAEPQTIHSESSGETK